jgi:hypothetical protein
VTEAQGTGTDLDGALRFAHQVMRRRGIIAVISDFQARDYQRSLGVLRRRHDVIAIHVHDPRESELPAAGLVALADPETGELRVVDVSDAGTRRRLRPASFEEADRVFRRTRVDCVRLSTAESYERPLTSFFRAREKRR